MNFVNFATTARLQNDSATSSQNEDFQGLALQTLLNRRFDNLRLELDAPASTFWCMMKPTGRPSYTHALMQDISEMQDLIVSSFPRGPRRENSPFNWMVMASAVEGIYNLGGDLGHFAQRIRQSDLDAMRHYGHVAVKAVHRHHMAFDAPVITMALVQGDALGGGFENALCCDIIVAERNAKMGLPEVLFNLFPGMGAYSFLTRRVSRKQAEEMILSGRIYTAEELHEMGVVDVLAEDGQGVDCVQGYIAKHNRKFNAHLATIRARRRVNPITLEELIDVVDIWAEAAVNLTEADLRKMDKLCAAQDRRLAALQPQASMIMAAE
ncbi:crotonase/enoyl-CoA hydratase family protein [Acidocella facilis]|uniref:crotonase/enoyl-CoA hydratase family protein n=1 Tax=Acidocella facilis TaxID=525 RepID=UPI000479F49F|nr:crotonase/enoyl-CoA hydratase family protein [Acidocella facilis]